jgi:hypothetical protein
MNASPIEVVSWVDHVDLLDQAMVGVQDPGFQVDCDGSLGVVDMLAMGEAVVGEKWEAEEDAA